MMSLRTKGFFHNSLTVPLGILLDTLHRAILHRAIPHRVIPRRVTLHKATHKEGIPLREDIPLREGIPLREDIPLREGIPLRQGIPQLVILGLLFHINLVMGLVLGQCLLVVLQLLLLLLEHTMELMEVMWHMAVTLRHMAVTLRHMAVTLWHMVENSSNMGSLSMEKVESMGNLANMESMGGTRNGSDLCHYLIFILFTQQFVNHVSINKLNMYNG